MEQKKYASLESLQIFKENSDRLYATQDNVDELSNALNTKANTNHSHAISDVINLQLTINEINDDISQKSQVQMITSDNSDNTTEVLSTLKIHKITQEQYEEKLANGTLEDNALYLTPDEGVDLSSYATVEQLNNKADAVHSHDENYDIKGTADEALVLAKSYADDVANTIKSDLLNGAGAAYDTLKELGDLINENVDAIEALETVASGKADANHTHNDIYYTETEIDNKVSTINNSIITSLNESKLYFDEEIAMAKADAINQDVIVLAESQTYTDKAFENATAQDVAILHESQTYTDNAVAQKSQVQIIVWEDDD